MDNVACFRWEAVATGEHMEFDVRGMMAEPGGKTCRGFGMKELVCFPGNVEDRS